MFCNSENIPFYGITCNTIWINPRTIHGTVDSEDPLINVNYCMHVRSIHMPAHMFIAIKCINAHLLIIIINNYMELQLL